MKQYRLAQSLEGQGGIFALPRINTAKGVYHTVKLLQTTSPRSGQGFSLPQPYLISPLHLQESRCEHGDLKIM